MLFLKDVFHFSDGNIVLSCVHHSKYQFNIPKEFDIYIDFKLHCQVKVIGIVMRKYEYINDTFNYIDINVEDIDVNILSIGKYAILLPRGG